MVAMRQALYVMNYHNVAWEDSLLTRALYGTIRPDIFRDHLAWYKAHGDLVSTRDALDRLASGRSFGRPAFCLWFDDGFSSVARHAIPLCKEYAVTAAQSVVSRFVLREEFYYLAKVSLLAMTDGLRFLRSRLRTLDPGVPLRFREWLKSSFSLEAVGAIDEVYMRFTTPAFRADAWRLYADYDQIRFTADEGWLIANHSAAHYPIVDHRAWDDIEADLEECGRIVRDFEGADRYRVSPFSVAEGERRERLLHSAMLVQVENRANTPDTFQTGVIYRCEPGMGRAPVLPE